MSAVRTSVTTSHWDAGEAGCGRLIMGLKQRIERLSAGETLSVTATDPAARIDLAHWCHMTGHRLVSEDHPNYVLRRKGG